jgi:glycosyltransferase involved in cell wall biosynthesis
VRILVDDRVLRAGSPGGVERSLRTLLVGFERLEVEAIPARCGRLVARGDADVLLSPVTAVPPLGKLPRVATIHDLPWLSGARAERREWRQRIRTRLTRRVAGAIVVPSEATAAALRRMPGGPAPIRVVPPGIHPDLLEPSTAAVRSRVEARLAGRPRPWLLAVGAVRRRKGQETLVRAVDEGTLVCVGPGTERLEGDRVLGVGRVDDDLLRSLYDATDALVHAASVEGCGLVLLEAMGRGLPVIALRTPAVEETVGDAGVLSETAEDLAAAIRRVAGDGSLRADLVRRGRERVATRTPEAQAAGVLEACRLAVRGAR